MARTFIVVCGGPGLFNSNDSAHDKSWDNYVRSIVTAALNSKPPNPVNGPKQTGKCVAPFWVADEELLWLVYKPAFDNRWSDDRSKKDFREKHVIDIINQGFKSYCDKLESRARRYGWTLKWISTSSQFWQTLTLNANAISRVWYFGHASGDLWLVLDHDHDAPVEPTNDAIIKTTDIGIDSSVADCVGPQLEFNPNTVHKFYGCNTDVFAKKWSSTFRVWTSAFHGKLDFSTVHQQPDWMPVPDPNDPAAQMVGYKPDGTEWL